MLENSIKFKVLNYWRNIDKKILLSFLLLFFLGLFFSFSSTSSLAGERLNKDYYFFFSKHLIFSILALLIMISISAIDTLLLKKLVLPLFILSFIFLALVPIIGVEVKGARRWLDLYFLRLQPIEVLKPFFILTTVKILTLERLQNSQIKYFFSFLLLFFVIILLIDQPDLGQSILLIGTWVATVFISQFYGISLTPDQYLMVILTATLASIGTAAVPGVGLVMLTMVLAQVGLPVEGIGLIIGVDRLLDMLRTAVNVTGDGTVSTLVASTEGDLDRQIFADGEVK